jgi:internalin A
MAVAFVLCLELTSCVHSRSGSVNSARPKKSEGFLYWCQQRKSFPIALTNTSHTIDVLLNRTRTSNCEVAERQLSQLTELDLIDRRIVDLKPLASLVNLSDLKLWKNQIVDVKPLSGLTKLTKLTLSENQIIDVRSLSGLTELTKLYIDRNQIVIENCPVKPESICTSRFEEGLE